MKHIDPHVHCRGDIWVVSALARRQGIAAIFDMPNTNPPILRKWDVIKRLRLAAKRAIVVKYFLYVGLTSGEKQIKEAVGAVRKYPEAAGLKLYTAGSGRLAVADEKDQQRIYRILAGLGYQGVLAVHCEKESMFKTKLWNPQESWTHALAKPPEAEIESVKDQIKFAAMSHFRGHLHICHVSCPESVDLVWEAKKNLRITSAVTPHHILWSSDKLKEINGLFYKVNPPLRDKERVSKLREYLRQGKIDWIETDHALHTLQEKFTSPYLSGIPSLYFYQNFLIWLNQHGFSQAEIETLTYWNIKRVFGKKLDGV